MRTVGERGYSLIELMLVVGLLALIATLAVPQFGTLDETELDRAADSVASALRFARGEAVRTGQTHGVFANPFDQTLKVYRLDESESPPVPVYDVRDPVSKQPYEIRFDSGGVRPTLQMSFFDYEDTLLPLPYVRFSGAVGVPKHDGLFGVRMLDMGYIRIGLDGETRTIDVSPMTARVSVR